MTCFSDRITPHGTSYLTELFLPSSVLRIDTVANGFEAHKFCTVAF